MSTLRKALQRPSTLKRAASGCGGGASTLGRALDSGKKRRKKKKKAEDLGLVFEAIEKLGEDGYQEFIDVLEKGKKEKKKPNLAFFRQAAKERKAKKKEEKKADVEITPSAGFVLLSGTKSEQAKQAYEALCKMTSEYRDTVEGSRNSRRQNERTAEEKTALYADCGEKLHVNSGEYKGKNGLVVGKTKKRRVEEWMDDEGANNERRKEDQTYTLKFDDDEGEHTFDEPNTQLEYYNEEKAAADECDTPGEKLKSKGKGKGEARGKGRGPIGVPVGLKQKRADIKAEIEKLSFIDSGPYVTPGNKIKCTKGDHKGKRGIVYRVVDEEEEKSVLEEDGTVVNRERREKKITFKPEGEDDKITVNGTECAEDYDSDSECEPCEVKAGAASDQEDQGDREELATHLEKISKLVSRRILNGDVALDKLILALDQQKAADSQTVDAKVQVNETQEGVEPYPRGDQAGGEQEALRVEPVPSNIEKMDQAVAEAQA